MPQLEHIEAIEKCLWSAADNLRANSNNASKRMLRFASASGSFSLRSRIRSASS